MILTYMCFWKYIYCLYYFYTKINIIYQSSHDLYRHLLDISQDFLGKSIDVIICINRKHKYHISQISNFLWWYILKICISRFLNNFVWIINNIVDIIYKMKNIKICCFLEILTRNIFRFSYIYCLYDLYNEKKFTSQRSRDL